jgi:hypothetical protein
MVVKRIFNLLVVLSIFISPVGAVQEKAAVHNVVIAPSWSEFCPARFVNAQYRHLSDIDFEAMHTMPYCTSQKKWVKVTNKILILPALDCWGATEIRKSMAFKEINEHNQNLSYWNSRKELFDSAIATCASSPVESQAACYMQVRQLELQRKQLALQSLQTDIMYNQSRTQSLNNINQTIQMQNMNSNMNNINNNLNRLYYH